jgi:hypothetical protein
MGRTAPHCIVGRIVTRRGRNGLPECHRETDACQERHAPKWIKDGWEVLIRDSEMPLKPECEPSQSGPLRHVDTGDERPPDYGEQ